MLKTWNGKDVKEWKDGIPKHKIQIWEETGPYGAFIGKDWKVFSDGVPMWRNLKKGTRIDLNCFDAEHAVKNEHAEYVFETEYGVLKGGSGSVNFYSFDTSKEEKHSQVNLPSHILKKMGWKVHDTIYIDYDKSRGIVELRLVEGVNIVKDKEEIYNLEEVKKNINKQ